MEGEKSYTFLEYCPECKKQVLCALISDKTNFEKDTKTFKFKCKTEHTFKIKIELKKKS